MTLYYFDGHHNMTRTLFADDAVFHDVNDRDKYWMLQNVVITDIYPAGEDPIPGVSAEALCQSIVEKEGLEVHYVPNREHLVDEVLPLLRPGDIIMTLGAGNIWETSVAIVEALGKEST